MTARIAWHSQLCSLTVKSLEDKTSSRQPKWVTKSELLFIYLLVTKYSFRNSKATRILFYKNLCTGPVSIYSSTSMLSLDHVSDHVKWSFVNSKPIILLIDMCLAHFCPVPVCSRYVTRNGARAGTYDLHKNRSTFLNSFSTATPRSMYIGGR